MQYESKSKPMTIYISEKLQEIVDLQRVVEQKDVEIHRLTVSVAKHTANADKWKRRALRAEALNDRNSDNAE